MQRISRHISRFLLIVSLFLISVEGVADSQTPSTGSPKDDTWMIFARAKLENEGLRYVDEGKYEEALEKFKAENSPDLRPAGAAFCGTAVHYMQRTYFLLGQYKDALSVLAIPLELYPGNEVYTREKLELEAIIEAQKTGSNQPVYDFLKYMEGKYKKDLPPTGATMKTENIIPIFIRLYDLIGDFDGGIRFADRISEYWYHKYPALKRIENSDDTIPYIEYRDRKGRHHPYWGAYSRLRENYRIREGFERDKADGRKSCLGVKPDNVCPGRATKALIQSDYFPW